MSLPKENLDNKTFDELVKEAVTRIPVYASEWTDHNAHDPGITFIELFAWLVEMQLYRLNRITEKSYRKFLKLLGIPKLKPAIPAEVDVAFTLKAGVTPPVSVPAGTIVSAKDPITSEDILFTTKEDIEVNAQGGSVSAIQQTDQKTEEFSSNGLPDFSIDLKHVPVLENLLTVKVSGDKWKEIEDFDASVPEDMHYTIDLSTGRITFGSGVKGKIPPQGTNNIKATYYSGGGVIGNVKARAINRIIGSLADKVTVINAKSASGGEEAETIEQAIYRARVELKEITRAVTSQDYEYLTLNTPGLSVARAKCLPRYHPSHDDEVPGIVSVIVVPESTLIPDADFLKTVYEYLDTFRLLTTELFVIPPEYVEVSVKATVVIKPKYLKETVKGNVNIELKNFLNPITGGVDGKGWPFGRAVYMSEIYEVIDGVEGVDYVKAESVTLNEETVDVIIPKHALACSGVYEITAKE